MPSQSPCTASWDAKYVYPQSHGPPRVHGNASSRCPWHSPALVAPPPKPPGRRRNRRAPPNAHSKARCGDGAHGGRGHGTALAAGDSPVRAWAIRCVTSAILWCVLPAPSWTASRGGPFVLRTERGRGGGSCRCVLSCPPPPPRPHPHDLWIRGALRGTSLRGHFNSV